jgi:hypothetical protein
LEERERLIENKRLVAAAKYAVWMRNYQRARVRALTRLAKAYPDHFKELFEEERTSDYTQGKAWIDLDGNTNNSMGANTGANSKAGSRDTFREAQSRDNREDQGDLE